MIKRIFLAAILLAAVFGGVIGFKLYKQAAVRAYLAEHGNPAVPLRATVSRADTWEQRLPAIGSLRARRGIEIRSEVNAVIRKLHVNSRDVVQAGDLLVELDDTIDRATLKSARVRLERAHSNFKRDSALFERSLLSEEQFEDSRAELQSAEALVEETQGIIDRKTIRAPFAGTVGIHSLNAGQYLEQGDEIVTLQALDSLYLDFSLPEKELERLRPGQRVVFRVPTHGDREFTGELRFIDVRVETTTRNVLVRALVDNADRALLPGMFASISVILDEASEVVTVPRQAVAFSLYGETVYLLEQEPAGEQRWFARRRAVTSGELRDGRIAVQGIPAGSILALDTQNRLLEGTPVVIVNPEVLAGAARSKPADAVIAGEQAD
ncbi:efflux RND transporter periplasmic adaptor subunit [Haliea sp. E17]|uniref:efflux RND transporter periplasmic adaptor subunit n=1 Tax=Haliea sp. E17 TaxID=3401576 RepID=UPI003AAFBD29